MKLFSKECFEAEYYRIPSLITTNKGTVIACVDARYDTANDNPNRIDKVVRRSTDHGETWGEAILAVECIGKGGMGGAAALDPALLYDQETDTIWMFYSHTPGGVGLRSMRPGKGMDEEGNYYLYDIYNTRYILKNEHICTEDGNDTGYIVDSKGYIYKDGKELGNIAAGIAPFLKERTNFLQAAYSKDDGLTWSEPINFNTQVKEEWMRSMGIGPGIGIQMQTETYKGRLVVPVHYSNYTNSMSWGMSSAVIISDDYGKTWHRGTSPNDGRVFKGEIINSRTLLDEQGKLTESQVVELNDGRLMCLMRNHHPCKRTARAYSEDGGLTWGEIDFVEELINPTCQASLIHYPDLGDGKERILFANPASETQRKYGTVRLSEDGGKTFPYSKQITDGDFIYNSMTVLADGSVGMLYEGRGDCKDMEFIKFSLEWIKN